MAKQKAPTTTITTATRQLRRSTRIAEAAAAKSGLQAEADRQTTARGTGGGRGVKGGRVGKIPTKRSVNNPVRAKSNRGRKPAGGSRKQPNVGAAGVDNGGNPPGAASADYPSAGESSGERSNDQFVPRTIRFRVQDDYVRLGLAAFPVPDSIRSADALEAGCGRLFELDLDGFQAQLVLLFEQTWVVQRPWWSAAEGGWVAEQLRQVNAVLGRLSLRLGGLEEVKEELQDLVLDILRRFAWANHREDWVGELEGKGRDEELTARAVWKRKKGYWRGQEAVEEGDEVEEEE
ncbi:hypothetical protein ABW19_dt0207531 [Dactylella cylindrospora]|nr:hypothetical protein ABW19_dt0207531 [Dactylella cylindrospora]